MRILILIATYNEAGNLEPLVEEVLGAVPSGEVLVIDDNSPDGTGVIAEKLSRTDPRVRVIRRSHKMGLGSALTEGMRYAVREEYDRVITMDADFSHPPRYLPELLRSSEVWDVVIGSRYIDGGRIESWHWSRRAISLAVNSLVRAMMGIPARDTSGGFRCYRVSRMPSIEFEAIFSRGYSIQEELLLRCHRAGFSIGEVPITFERRREGDSKVGLFEAARSMATILRLGLDRGGSSHRP